MPSVLAGCTENLKKFMEWPKAQMGVVGFQSSPTTITARTHLSACCSAARRGTLSWMSQEVL